MHAELNQFGRGAPVVFFCVMSLLTAMGIPRMLFYPVAGLAFGFWTGFVWSIAGTIMGAYSAFIYARWAGRGFVEKTIPGLISVTDLIKDQTFATVALMRQIPAPGHILNLLFGISPVEHKHFLLGTIIGSLPAAIPALLIGSSVMQPDDNLRILKIVLSATLLMIMWLGFAWHFRKSERYNEMNLALKALVSRR